MKEECTFTTCGAWHRHGEAARVRDPHDRQHLANAMPSGTRNIARNIVGRHDDAHLPEGL